MCIEKNWSILIDMHYMEEMDTQNQIITLKSMTHTLEEDSLVLKNPILAREDGQSAIEFILTFAFSLGFVFLFVNLALNLTAGYLNHYVNFMASRAYLTADTGVDNVDNTLNNAAGQARAVFDKYPLTAFGIDAEFEVVPMGTRNGLFVGTTSTFSKPISSMSIVGSTEEATLLSESLIGKEPVRRTCYDLICGAMTGNPSCNSPEEFTMVLYDNGC